MNPLETVNPVERLHDGKCPICNSNLKYMHVESHAGTLANDGTSLINEVLTDRTMVYCETCGYEQPAIMIGLKTIPADRVLEFDTEWDKRYLVENTIIHGRKGVNPFKVKE